MECVCVLWFHEMERPTQICHHIFRYSFLIYFSQFIFRAHSSYLLQLFSVSIYVSLSLSSSSFCLWFIFGMVFFLLPFEKLHHSGLCECVQSRGFRGHYIIVRVLCVDAIYLKYHKSKGMTQSSRSLSVQRQWQRLKATESQNEKNKYTLLRMESNFMKTCCCLRTRMRRKQHEYILTTSSTNLCTSTHVESHCQPPTQPIFQLLHL